MGAGSMAMVQSNTEISERILTSSPARFSPGIFGLGVLYDFWTLNDQISPAMNDVPSPLRHSPCFEF
jgi:hypothetical protein